MARKAGFDRPILHGLCTNGIACRAVLSTYCADDPTRLRSMFVRLSQPVYPGETLRVELFEEARCLRFRVIAVERDATVLDRGHAELSG
jgi:acyl dehydratase